MPERAAPEPPAAGKALSVSPHRGLPALPEGEPRKNLLSFACKKGKRQEVLYSLSAYMRERAFADPSASGGVIAALQRQHPLVPAFLAATARRRADVRRPDQNEICAPALRAMGHILADAARYLL